MGLGVSLEPKQAADYSRLRRMNLEDLYKFISVTNHVHPNSWKSDSFLEKYKFDDKGTIKIF